MPGLSKLVSLVAVAIDKAGLAQVSQVKTVQAVSAAADKPPKVSVGDARGALRVHVGATTTIQAAVSDPDSEGTAQPVGGGHRHTGPVRRAFEVSSRHRPGGVLS